MDILLICIRTIISYIVLVFCLRFMGKKEISQLNLFDLIILLSIADIMIIGIENFRNNFLYSVIPVFLLALIQKVVSKILLKVNKLRKLIDGSFAVLIIKGKIDYQEMKKQGYNVEDLLLQLRLLKIYDIQDVEYGILETNGKFTAYQKDPNRVDFCPIPIIISGEINLQGLKLCDKNREWVYNKLGNIHQDIRDIDCAYYENNDLFIINKLSS